MAQYLGQQKTAQYLGENPSYYPGDGEIDHLIDRIERAGRKATRDEIAWLQKAAGKHQVTVREGNSSHGYGPSGFAKWLANNEGITSKLKEVPGHNSSYLGVEVQHYSSSERDRLANKTSGFTVDDLLKIRKIEGPISFVERNTVKSMPADAIREYAQKRPQRFSTLEREIGRGSRTFYVAGDPHTAKQLEEKAKREESTRKSIEADEQRIFNEKKAAGNGSSLYWFIGGGILLTALALKK